MRAEIQMERFEMGVKQYRPTSPGRRFQTVSDKAEITCDKPEKSLLAPLVATTTVTSPSVIRAAA